MTSRLDPCLEQPGPRPGRWRRVREAHFQDYSRPALRMWLAIVIAGASACAWALHALWQQGAPALGPIGIGLAMVAAAAWFPIEIPRSKYSIGASDAFIFTMLAMLGPPAAVLAAGVEGAVGAWRSTRRLTSRISTPMAAMAAMAAGGEAFQALWTTAAHGMEPAVAKLVALTLVALLPFALSSYSLTSTVTLKRGQWPKPGAWFVGSAWIAALYLAAALLAGLVQLGTAGRGPLPATIVGAATLAMVVLLRLSVRRGEAERRAQDERIRVAEYEAASSQQRFVAAFTSAAIGMAIVDSTGRIVRANRSLCSLLQRPDEALHGCLFSDLLHPEDLHLFLPDGADPAQAVDASAPPVELRCRAPADDELWVALHSSRFDDPDGPAKGVIHQLHDITAHRAAQQRLQHIAYHDSLTRLPNRAAFYERVSSALAAAASDPSARFAVVFLDLDRFKVVNDSLGHVAGNELLCEVARRLSRGLRAADMAARLGGDEFAVFLLDADLPSCLGRTERMLADLSAPFTLKGQEVIPGASAGLTFSDLGSRNVDEMLRDADLAMYEAKAGGTNGVSVFDRTMHTRIADKLALETDLRHAIASDGLAVVFQPVFELRCQRLVGFEALARWDHPTRGPVPPTTFVALAEEAGHISALTAWVLDKALAHLGAWRASTSRAVNVSVQVNISGHDLSQPGFVEQVIECLARHAVPARLLTLEITESVLMHRIEAARQTLGRLRAAGVQLAIDDFGTGYSSLSYLSRLPIDSIKIDRSFVWAMDATGQDMEIVKAVIQLGHALGKKIVAEGIETRRQQSLLRDLGVDEAQGYLLGRPMAAEHASSMLALALAPPTEADRCTAA
jgi:diguanylate cyclase (GGDEF)-like protein/PAS domain S-box-containing protein